MDIPKQLPSELCHTYLKALNNTQLTRELLTAKVRKYLDTISTAAQDTTQLDIDTSSKLAQGLLRLLRSCSTEGLVHAQAAVYYFLDSNDAKPDLDSTSGFKDDAAVFNAVCHHLEMPELTIEIPS